MASVKVLDAKGKETGSLTLKPDVFGVEVRTPLLHQAVVSEQPEVPRHARLGDAEDAGELRDIQAFSGQHPQDPQARLVAEQPEQGRRVLHIYKSIYIDGPMSMVPGTVKNG